MEVPLLLLSVLLLGLVRGAAVCVAVCGPGLLSYVVIKRKSPLEALRLSILFSLPRSLLLILLGALVGFLAHGAASLSYLNSLSTTMHSIVYIAFGVILTAMGFYLFAKAIDERSDFREGKARPEECVADVCGRMEKAKKGKKGGLFSRILDPGNVPKRWKESCAVMLLGWGMGLGCMAEVAILEGTAVSGGAALHGSTALGSAALGAAGMALFSLGLAIPLSVLCMAAAALSKRMDTLRRLNVFKTMASAAMMILGVLIVLFQVVL